MKTTQFDFHPYRGHMEDGCIIKCENGEELKLCAVMDGWRLFKADGNGVGHTTKDAFQIQSYVLNYGR